MATKRKQSQQKTNSDHQKNGTRNGSTPPDFDTILESVGEFGPTQILHLTVMCFAAVCRGAITVAAVFLCKTPIFHCQNRPTEDPCLLEPPCHKFGYDTPDNFTSIVTEWDLVCHKNEYPGLTQSAMMFGTMCGTYFLSPYADQYGRKSFIQMGNLVVLIGHLIATFSTTYTQFTTARFLLGLGLGASLIPSVWIIENSHSKWRSVASLCHNMCFSIGMMMLAIFAYYFRDWRELSFYIFCVMVPAVILLFWIIPESPRWLISTGQIQDAEDILLHIGRQNSREITRRSLSLSDLQTTQNNNVKKCASVLSVFKTPAMRQRMLILMWNWATCVLVFYGLTMGSSDLGGNMYLNVALSGFIDIPASTLTGSFSNIFGRKKSTIFFTFLGCIGCLGVVIAPYQTSGEMTQLQTSLAMVGKLGISSAFALLYIYTGELLPTEIRSGAFGLCSTIGRTGGIVQPMITSMGDPFAYTTYGLMAIISCVLSSKLPETLNQPLPDTIDDIEQTHREYMEKKQR